MYKTVRYYSKFNIYYQNFRGMRSKLREIHLASLVSQYDVIVATETWLNDNINDSELFNTSYKIYRRDRSSTSLGGKEGGGVLIAVSKMIQSSRLIKWETNCEDLWISLKTHTNKEARTLNICVVYLPPPVSQTLLDSFLDRAS